MNWDWKKPIDWVSGRGSDIMDMFRSHPFWASLATVGTLLVTKKVCEYTHAGWKYFLRPNRNLFKIYGTENSWAVITGGSSGIGLAYAKVLAKAGFNLLLIARDQIRLDSAKAEILKDKEAAACQIQTVSFDFGKPYNEEGYKVLSTALVDKEVAVLVNNVGTDHACEFIEYSSEYINEMINVNVTATTFMTWLVVPRMMARLQRSAIINISSSFTGTYFPYFNIYIATKSYVNSLMRCLHHELKDKRIDVLTCLTGEVMTPRNKMRSMWHETPENVARSQLNALGRESETYGNFRHAMYAAYLRSCLSNSFKHWLGNTVRGLTLGELKKAPKQ